MLYPTTFGDGLAAQLRETVCDKRAVAVKFTPVGGRIGVVLSCDSTTAKLTVSDTGEGISSDVLPHIFEILTQGSGATAKGGLGLGLAIVQQLVMLHHGTIEARSDGLGKGAQFTLRLPLVAARA